MLDIFKTIARATWVFYLFLLSCSYDASYIKNLSSDITTSGFINDDCYQCIITAKPDPGIEGLVASRESAHINLMQSIESQCYQELINAVLRLQKINGDSYRYKCLVPELKPFVEKRIIVASYYNEDFSETAVVRIFKTGLKQKLSNLQCK